MGFGEPLTQNDLTIWSETHCGLGAHSEHLGTSQHLKENVMQYFYIVFKSRIFKEIPCLLPLQYKCYRVPTKNALNLDVLTAKHDQKVLMISKFLLSE